MRTQQAPVQSEPILEPAIRIIDAHHHLFDRPALRYLFGQYLDDINAGHRIVASVFVEAQAVSYTDGPALMRPLAEIEFANGIAAMSASEMYGPCRVGAAIVGHVDMRSGDAVAAFLERALAIAPDRFRGIRQITIEHHREAPFRYIPNRPAPGILDSPGFELAFRHLAPLGLSFDAAVFHTQLSRVAALAGAFPETTIVLNHMGLAVGLDMSPLERAEVFLEWSKQLRELAQHSNVFCKIGGLGLPFWGFGFEGREQQAGYLELAAVWRPYVETAIDAFGPSRCMMESNFPPDRQSCSFVSLWNALKHIARAYSDADKAALFHGTAARVYRIELPDETAPA